MKLLLLMTHPIAVICSFLLILISGEHFGGFFVIYLLLALPYGGVHAIFALAGVGTLLFSIGKYKQAGNYLIEPILNFLGVACLFASLAIFFINSRGYNDSSFDQAIPLITMGIFVMLSVGLIVISAVRYFKPLSKGFFL